MRIFRSPLFFHIYMVAAFLTVLMTYFGVNYILGGMHSYEMCIRDRVNPADIEYNSENAASWHNYMRNVAALLKADATNLYDSWNTR